MINKNNYLLYFIFILIVGQLFSIAVLTSLVTI